MEGTPARTAVIAGAAIALLLIVVAVSVFGFAV